MNTYIVYVKLDDASRVVEINSSAFLRDVTGWTKVDEGCGDKYHHAQGNYLPTPITDDRGVYCYKLEDWKVVSRSLDEMDTDYIEPEQTLTYEERISELEAQNAFLTDCLLEMSEIVYS